MDKIIFSYNFNNPPNSAASSRIRSYLDEKELEYSSRPTEMNLEPEINILWEKGSTISTYHESFLGSKEILDNLKIDLEKVKKSQLVELSK